MVKTGQPKVVDIFDPQFPNQEIMGAIPADYEITLQYACALPSRIRPVQGMSCSLSYP
jgi:hypothetical protein